jgi:hypothetical protein
MATTRNARKQVTRDFKLLAFPLDAMPRFRPRSDCPLVPNDAQRAACGVVSRCFSGNRENLVPLTFLFIATVETESLIRALPIVPLRAAMFLGEFFNRIRLIPSFVA